MIWGIKIKMEFGMNLLLEEVKQASGYRKDVKWKGIGVDKAQKELRNVLRHPIPIPCPLSFQMSATSIHIASWWTLLANHLKVSIVRESPRIASLRICPLCFFGRALGAVVGFRSMGIYCPLSPGRYRLTSVKIRVLVLLLNFWPVFLRLHKPETTLIVHSNHHWPIPL